MCTQYSMYIVCVHKDSMCVYIYLYDCVCVQAQGRSASKLPDAAAYVRSMPDLRKPMFDETYDSNEVQRSCYLISFLLYIPIYKYSLIYSPCSTSRTTPLIILRMSLDVVDPDEPRRREHDAAHPHVSIHLSFHLSIYLSIYLILCLSCGGGGGRS
jgi:hypothetical protein